MRLPSFPSRERGLKPLRRRNKRAITRSFPSRERGLKLTGFLRNLLQLLVVPFAGTWIETWLLEENVTLYQGSFPSRERGLKQEVLMRSTDLCAVVPFAGTWIETN